MRLWVVVVALVIMVAEGTGQVKKQRFGKTREGTPIDIYTLKSDALEARIMTYGGIVVSLKAPDRNGKPADVVLGFDTLDDYLTKNKPYFGALIGRYANRIAGGKFTLDGKTYSIPQNDGTNALHGGTRGFDKVVWTATEIPHGIELRHTSPDGDQGFPGTLKAVVRYSLVAKELKIEYSATSDKDTVLNLTNHSYFNLAGQGNADILHHELKLAASRYTPVNDRLIPTGELRSVDETPFDFRRATAVGERIDAADDQLRKANGYDHNFVLDSGGKFALAAELYDPTSGRVLQVLTDQPGIQFYSGNFLDGTITGKDGKAYGRRSALCLETQHFPDSPNHPEFPSTELKPGERYHTVTIYRFTTR
jgi:aldose 1-epimerase